jgi:hypothetical protein
VPRRSLVGLAAVVAAGTLLVSACGGDDDDAEGSRRSDAPETTARPDSDAGDATTTTTAGGTTDEGATGSSANADEIGEMDFCDGFRAAIRLDSATALAGARQLEPPDQIAADWQVFLDFAASSMSADPAPGSAADVETAGAAAQEATTHILDYVGQECGYSVDAFSGEVTENDDG